MRVGLGSVASARPYRVPWCRMGVRPEVDLDLVRADRLEDAETLRKLDLGK
jgi:hypothetical protein